MTRSERECLAKRIVQHYVDVANRQKKITVNHFLQEKIPRRNIYYIINKFEQSGTIDDKPRSGRPKKLSKRQLSRLKRLVDQKTGVSLRQIAPKFDVSISIISRQLKAMGITYRKKKRAPKYTDRQLEEIPTRSRRLYRKLLSDNFELVMDDEKYFLLHNESVATNCGFYTSNTSAAPPHVKFKRTRKLEPKLLVWIAVSEKGISTPFFGKQKQAITQTTYLNECIKGHLIPFIQSYHSKEKVLFWPDLASSHYGHNVTEYFDLNGICFVHKQENPQNCPQARPIEALWSVLEQMVYGGGWEAKSLDQLKRRVATKLKELDVKVVQAMFLEVRKQLRRIADKGPYEACSF